VVNEETRSKEDIAKDIKFILEDKIAPAVAQHNGFINYLDFDVESGVAKLELAGACSGCAMSKQTLHQSVEDMLKHYVPEVKSIVGEDDVKAEEQGYKPFVPRNEFPDFDSEEEKRLKGLIDKEYKDSIDN